MNDITDYLFIEVTVYHIRYFDMKWYLMCKMIILWLWVGQISYWFILVQTDEIHIYSDETAKL